MAQREILRKAQGKDPLDVIQEASRCQRSFDGLEPIPIDSPVWETISACGEALLELAQSPRSFRTRHWVERGVLKRCTGKAVKDRNTYQGFYT